MEQALRQSYNELDAQQNTTLEALGRVDDADGVEPTRPTADLECLDALPYLTANLDQAPHELLRRLVDVAQLTIRLHTDDEEATMDIRLPAEQLPKIALTVERTTDAMPTTKTRSADSTSQRTLGGSCTYPRWDSNPRYRRERPAS